MDTGASAPQLPHEILVHISTFSRELLQQLLLNRPFYEFFRDNRQYIIQLHTLTTVNVRHTTRHMVFGKLHSEDGPAVEDLRCKAPAIIRANGEQEWYRNGRLHRENGPAVIYNSGTQIWYQNGKLHREDGPAVEAPAVIRADGSQEWWLNGKLHRDDGPAIIWSDGAQEWHLNGELHREDGPAVEDLRCKAPAVIRANGRQEWWQNDKRHRRCKAP